MIGAVLGDMAGTPLEDGSYKTRDDDLFLEDYSDVSLDSVMAVAVAEALLNTKVHAASWEIRSAVFGRCEKLWKGYAASEDKAVFFTWLIDDDTATLKRVRLFDDHIILEPENPTYKPKVFWNEDMNRVRVIGKATHFISAVK